MSKPIVLVTGGTGFLGAWVILQLLEQGYTVRAAVRTGKESKIRALFPDAGSKIEIVEVASLSSDYTAAVTGVGAVIHCASPTYLKGETGQEILDGAYHGTVNLVNTAIAAGVKKIVVTGTIISLWGADFKKAFETEPITNESFGAITFGDIKPNEDSVFSIYQASKTITDKKLWEISAQYPDVDITVIIPPVILGPVVPNFPLPAEVADLGTIAMIHQLISLGPDTYPPIPLGYMADPRDVAKAHVLALTAPSPSDGLKRRFILSSRTFKWDEAAKVIRKAHPELIDRLPNEKAVPPAQTAAPLDTSLTSEVLGLKEYIPWEKSILDCLEVVLRWENTVKK